MLSESRYYEQRSRENLVFFFRVELLVTLGNPRHRPCLPKSTFRFLVKSGDLRIERYKMAHLHYFSPRVIKLLELSKMTKNALLGLSEISPDMGYHVPVPGRELISIEEVEK